MRLIPLGTNGFYPSHGRQTMAFLLLTDAAAILLDAGSGVARLAEKGVNQYLEGHDLLHVFLSHYHLDHVIGLSYLPAVWPRYPVRIYAPGPPLVDVDPAEALCRLIHPPYFPIPMAEFPMPVELERLAGEAVTVAGIEVRYWRQDHPGGSVGYRFGDRLAYVTDTVGKATTAQHVAGVDLLLHEVWTGAGGEEASALGHSTVDRVARIARDAEVRRLMLVHHHPSHSAEDLRVLAAELASIAPGIEVLLPQEGRSFRIPEDAA